MLHLKLASLDLGLGGDVLLVLLNSLHDFLDVRLGLLDCHFLEGLLLLGSHLSLFELLKSSVLSLLLKRQLGLEHLGDLFRLFSSLDNFGLDGLCP